MTALPGVARVVHSKASCTVHWQESGRARPGGGARPGAKDLQTAQILGIHGPAPPPRGGPRAGRGADPRRAEPPPASDPPAEPGGDERKAPPPVAPPPSQTSSGPKVEAGNGEGPDAWAGPPEETGGGPPGAPSPGPERRPCGGVEDTPAAAAPAAPSPDTKPPGARGEEGGAPMDCGGRSGCSPITDPTDREFGPWLMLPLGPGLRFRLKGSEWNLLSLDSEPGGGTLEGGEAWLKSGGVSVRDLAGSSPTDGTGGGRERQPGGESDAHRLRIG